MTPPAPDEPLTLPDGLPRLEPVAPGAHVALDAASAGPPPGIPGKKELARHTKALLRRLAALQAAFTAEGSRSLLLVLQGRDAAGKDGTIRTVVGACNPIAVRVAAFGPPSTRELAHDFLWRVHQVVPPKAKIGVFNRSHYEDVLVVRVRGLAPQTVWEPRYRQIAEFERMLVENNTVILKCCLHVSRDEQRDRLQSRLDDPRKNWKFRLGDLDDRAHWDDYTEAYQDAIARTSTLGAPWFVVPADNKRVRNFLVARLLVETLEGFDLQYPQMDPDVAAAADGFS